MTLLFQVVLKKFLALFQAFINIIDHQEHIIFL